MAFPFETVDAARENFLVRAGFCGPAGSGKTYTTLLVATILSEMLDLGPVWLIDSENRSSLKHARSRSTGKGFHFKMVPLPSGDYSPQNYMDALKHCEEQGARIIIIDSLSHAWNGSNGVLEQVDRKTEQSRSKSSFTEGWRVMTPVQNKLIQRILGSSAHILLTLRAKVEWVVGDNDKGRKAPTRVGMAPVQREGVDYEPDLMFDLSVPDNQGTVSKSRSDRIQPGEVFEKPGWELALRLAEWVHDEDLPRSRDEALRIAIERGVQAMASPDHGRREGAAARDQLAAWCRASRWSTGVFRDEPVEDIIGQFRSGVAARVKASGAAPVAAA